MVNAMRFMMALCDAVADRSDTATHGGFEHAMPPQAAVITFARPSAS
jgi:hypothetical protein